MEKYSGFFPLYWNTKAGKLWLEIDKWNSEFLYVESLPSDLVAPRPAQEGRLGAFLTESVLARADVGKLLPRLQRDFELE